MRLSPYMKNFPLHKLIDMNNTEMTMDDRMELIDSIRDDMYGLCECFAEAEEEDNCRAVFEEFNEWFDGRECQVWWVPNFADVL
jgi:hypothetical protein